MIYFTTEIFKLFTFFSVLIENISGVYLGFDPALVVSDVELIKRIMITDFEHFVDRGIYRTPKQPITVNIFSQGGADWRNIRVSEQYFSY